MIEIPDLRQRYTDMIEDCQGLPPKALAEVILGVRDDAFSETCHELRETQTELDHLAEALAKERGRAKTAEATISSIRSTAKQFLNQHEVGSDLLAAAVLDTLKRHVEPPS